MRLRPIQCPHCEKRFGDVNDRYQHAKVKHRKLKIADLKPVREDASESIASQMIDASINRAMGEPNEEWLDDMLDFQEAPHA